MNGCGGKCTLFTIDCKSESIVIIVPPMLHYSIASRPAHCDAS